MHQQIWNNCLRVFKDNLEVSKYKTFFEPIIPIGVKQNVLTIQVPSQFYYEYLEEHYIDLLRKTIRRELGPGARLEYSIPVGNTISSNNRTIIPGNSGQRNFSNPPAPIPVSEKHNPFILPGLKNIKIDPQLNAEYSFTNFVEGDCNRLARSAGLAIAEKPGGTAFNPFFIYGDSGLGKTHLAQAIGIKVKEEMPEKTVLYVNATKFKTQFVDARLKNDINNFLHFYQCIDVLIIDDVQEFGNKEGTQRTFFDIFNHLHQRGKQLILTSDRAPVDLQGLIDKRLLSRFKWGLSTELQVPGYQTRLAILKQRAYRDGIELPEEVLEYVAKNIVNNVRELEGVLVGLLAQATLNKKAITLDLAQSTINKLIKHTRPEISIDYILQVVSDYFHLDEENILSNTRKREIVQARQVAMYLSKQFTKTSLKSIGAQLGNKDHATVLHACRTVNNLIETDRRFKTQIEELEGKFSN
ncbi:MAG: chromosomal replication initiator protein DnaA [Bacteroidales bacterium]|jgi:chromosomal replication initiator protein|nr:chromosomal replication initiator protein DnaA [Bacteroidales bacterium]